MAVPDRYEPTDSTRVRYDTRAHYDVETVHAILDSAFIAHVGLIAADGRPVVIPMTYARDGERVLLHGSQATRLARTLKGGVDVCVTVTHLDAIILARCAFNHSVNYRSAVVMGRATAIEDLGERAAALDLITEHIVPGRLGSLRPTSDKEVRATAVLQVPITEASAKIRSHGVADDDEDLDFPVWAGVVPIHTTLGAPVETDKGLTGLVAPEHLTRLWI